MFEIHKKEWDPFRLITEAEYYDNLNRIKTFSKSIFSGLAKIKSKTKTESTNKAA
jgi:hypothetical protein